MIQESCNAIDGQYMIRKPVINGVLTQDGYKRLLNILYNKAPFIFTHNT